MTDLQAKLEKYLKNAKTLFDQLEKTPDADIDAKKSSEKFYEMCMAYYNDARHFYENEEYFNALAALEYAEGWLDAGVELGILKTKKRPGV